MRTWMLIMAASVALATPAHAMRCSDWTSFDAEQRDVALRTAYRQLLASNKAKAWTSVNKSQIERCLIRATPLISIDFDDACAQGNRASLQVLDEILLDYARSCVR